MRKVFVDLYRAGLIYKDKRLVNWDPELLTAISDLEVEQIETKGHLWHLRYPIEGRPGEFIVVATTRPETMLGDTAVAVHPDDERYRHLIGKNVILPLVGRRIPIIADEYSDPEGLRRGEDHAGARLQRFRGGPTARAADDQCDEPGRQAPARSQSRVHPECRAEPGTQGNDSQFNGVFRFAARKMIVHQLEAKGLMEKIEPYVHTVPHGDRSNAVIEPRLTDQWYVDAVTLAKLVIEAVKRGRTNFVPKNWETTYFHWMENIQPWCISRQLWWQPGAWARRANPARGARRANQEASRRAPRPGTSRPAPVQPGVEQESGPVGGAVVQPCAPARPVVSGLQPESAEHRLPRPVRCTRVGRSFA